jgi:DNA-binding CsgD family transcriptional regulator
VTADTLARGRVAFEQDRWSDAVKLFCEADAVHPLSAEDLERLATAAYLAGADALNVDARGRAHQAYLERGDARAAARSAFWLGFTLMDRPDQQALAGGWLSRARHLLDAIDGTSVEHGFLLCADAYQHVVRGAFEAADREFGEAGRIGQQCGNLDLMSLARHGEGRILLGSGRTAEGLAVLDEVMAAVTGGRVAPLVTGVVYCSVIGACHDCFDLRRAREWTEALARWCDAHPDIVPFRGICLIRRSALLRLQGEWAPALTEATRACRHLDRPGLHHEIGAAICEVAELQRLRGEFQAAEASYRDAARSGRSPQPGLALLRLARGEVEAAVTAIGHALDETTRLPARVHVLRAAVEILLAGGEIEQARAAATDLATIAGTLQAPFVQAAALFADGTVLAARGDIRNAIGRLREACTLWTELDAAYEVARTSEQLGRAYLATGDREGAALQFDTAASLYEEIGAAPDVARLAAHATSAASASRLLTGREVEVLRLIATGRTNRAIANDLAISEKTVARHISNIFNKLDLSSRAAATAYAYRHKLV